MAASMRERMFGLLMFWTILTSLFAWLPLVRIIGRPEGYQWGILGLSGEGASGPHWIFIGATLFVLAMFIAGLRGPRLLFYPMVVVWHLAVTGIVAAGTVLGGTDATIQGQGLHWEFPLWTLVIPCALAAVIAIAWSVVDYRAGGLEATTPWSRGNSIRLSLSVLLLLVAIGLFRAGTNYDWVTALAIVVTVLHWILLVESLQPRPPATVAEHQTRWQQ